MPYSPTRTARVACAFVGLLDVEGRVGENAAYSPAGTQFQECLLRALAATNIDVTHAYALRPVPSFPRYRRLLFTARKVTLIGSIRTTLIGFVNFGPLKTITGGLTLFPRLLSWAWRERRRPRAILIYNLFSPPAIVSVLAARATGSRIIAIVADLQVPGHGLLPDTFLRRLDFWLQKRTLPACDGLIVLTRKMSEDFAPAVPSIQMEGALPDGLLDEPVPSAQNVPVAGTPLVLMYAGGLSELKGIDRLLEAFARVSDDGLRLWITGNGPLEGAVRSAAIRDCRITYWGFPAEDDLRSLYRSADVMVNPHSARHASSRYLFPSKLIEYLGTGKPVISTCSTPEILDEYGSLLFVTTDDGSEALARTIQAVAAVPRQELAAIGARARRYVVEHKSWTVQGGRIAQFISELAN